MDQDRVVGAAKKAGGKVEGAVGDLVGDEKTSASGRVTETEGTAQNVLGQAKDAVRDVAASATELAGSAGTLAGQALDQGRQIYEDGRKRLPEAGEQYRRGREVVGQHVGESPILALIVAGAVGYILALLVHGRSSS